MTDLEEYRTKEGSNWYEIDGMKFNGTAAAEEYLADRDEVDEEETTAVTSLKNAEEEARTVDEPVVPSDEVAQAVDKEFLMQMTRQSNLFEIVGPSGKLYKFGKQSPILVVKSEDVEEILNQGGFRLVSPDVAKEYYS